MTRAQRAYQAGLTRAVLEAKPADAPVGSGLEAAQKLVESLVGDQAESFDIASILDEVQPSASIDASREQNISADQADAKPAATQSASTAQRFILTPSEQSRDERSPTADAGAPSRVVTVHAPPQHAGEDEAAVQRAVAAMTAETRQMQGGTRGHSHHGGGGARTADRLRG
jgi:hypothetical protein